MTNKTFCEVSALLFQAQDEDEYLSSSTCVDVGGGGSSGRGREGVGGAGRTHRAGLRRGGGHPVDTS